MNAGVNRYIQNICTYIINGSGHVNAKKYACQNASVIYIVIYIYICIHVYLYVYVHMSDGLCSKVQRYPKCYTMW